LDERRSEPSTIDPDPDNPDPDNPTCDVGVGV
jgi:hypothetical protein